MCDLVSAFTIGSTIIGGIGAKKQGNANAAQARVEAAIARENAELVDLKIKDSIFRGKRTTRDVRREGEQVVGSQRAATGANNLDLNYGSPLDMVYETMRLNREDVNTAERNTASEIADLEQEKRNYMARAGGADASASNYKKAGTLNAIGTVLSGGSSVAKYRASIA